ncbi:MAG: hypothetical protein ACI9RV_001115 [Glaciecola sp.]|jgi:hypothetical protein
MVGKLLNILYLALTTRVIVNAKQKSRYLPNT